MLWLGKAAQQGYAPAQTSLGEILWDRANSVDQEWQARAWLLKAAERGDPYAQYLLARTYIAVNPTEAVKWYSKSAEQGFAPAQLGLGLSYWDTDYDKAVQGLQIAADHGIARAKTYLGYAYAKGLGGVPQDDNTAIRLWREAAAQNEPRAEEALGWAYEKGRGVPVNPSEARAWYQRAASHGNQAAESKLGSPETKSAGNYEVVAAILLGLLVIGIATAGSTQGVPAEDAPSGGGFMDMTDPTACGNYHDDGHQVMVV